MRDEPPDLKTHYGRLRFLRESFVKPDGGSFTSDRDAATFFGWPVESYRKHERGERQGEGFKLSTAKRYAQGYRADIGWLMTGAGGPFLRGPEKAAVVPTAATSRKRA